VNTMWIVLRKELLDSWRDKRTWRSMILFPILFSLLIFVGVPAMEKAQIAHLQKIIPVIAYTTSAGTNPVIHYLQATHQVHLQPESARTARADLLAKKVQAVLQPSRKFNADLQAGGTAKITILYNQVSDTSTLAATTLENLITGYSQRIAIERLAAKDLSPALAHPVQVLVNDISTAVQQGAAGLGTSLPLLLAVWSVSGGLYVAIDVGAGEKERTTLEPLLLSTHSRLGMVLGKYLTVLISSLFSSLLSILAFFLSSWLQQHVLKAGLGKSIAFALTPMQLLLILIGALCITSFVSAIELAVSIYARKVREAQTYLSILPLIVVIPGIILEVTSMSTLPNWYFNVPIFGAQMLMKEVITGTIDWSHVGQVTMVAAVLTALCVRFTVRQFKKESVLFRQ